MMKQKIYNKNADNFLLFAPRMEMKNCNGNP